MDEALTGLKSALAVLRRMEDGTKMGEELVRWEKLPSHIKEMEYVNNLPRAERRVIMRRQMIEIHGEEVANWSHENVRSAYNAWQRDRLLQRRI